MGHQVPEARYTRHTNNGLADTTVQCREYLPGVHPTEQNLNRHA
jgi:hypothetical protein